MHIVGIEASEPSVGEIHTIDVWFSQRRGGWIVERLNVDGDRLGVSHVCDSMEEAKDCLAEWLRTHGETHLVPPIETPRRRKVRRAA